MRINKKLVLKTIVWLGGVTAGYIAGYWITDSKWIDKFNKRLDERMDLELEGARNRMDILKEEAEIYKSERDIYRGVLESIPEGKKYLDMLEPNTMEQPPEPTPRKKKDSEETKETDQTDKPMTASEKEMDKLPKNSYLRRPEVRRVCTPDAHGPLHRGKPVHYEEAPEYYNPHDDFNEEMPEEEGIIVFPPAPKGKKPGLITETQYSEEWKEYGKNTVFYFTDDDTYCDDEWEIIDEWRALLGEDQRKACYGPDFQEFVYQAGKDVNYECTIYARNYGIKEDYEILVFWGKKYEDFCPFLN